MMLNKPVGSECQNKIHDYIHGSNLSPKYLFISHNALLKLRAENWIAEYKEDKEDKAKYFMGLLILESDEDIPISVSPLISSLR